MNEEILESTIQKLSKYAAFFKCELKEETSYRAFGFTSPEANDYGVFLKENNVDELPLSAVNNGGISWLNISSKHRLGEIWIKDSSALPAPLDSASRIELEHWHTLETECGIPALYSSSQEEFILQYLNLHHLGAVSFKKGCYTGQEIIARMKFLGKQKKQAYLLHSDQKCTQAPLSAAYDIEGKKCGTLIRSHYSEKTGTFALAILSIDAALNYSEVYLSEALNNAFSVSEIDYSEFKK